MENKNFSEEIERCIIGNLMVYPDEFTLLDNVQSCDFKDRTCGSIFQYLKYMHDNPSVGGFNALECREYLNSLSKEDKIEAATICEITACCHKDDFLPAVRIFKKRLKEKKIGEADAIFRQSCSNQSKEIQELIKNYQNTLEQIESDFPEEGVDRSNILQAVSQYFDDIENRVKSDVLVKTGINWLDNSFGGGLLGNEFIVVGARPSVGKTALALQIAVMSNDVVSIISLEMSTRQLIGRLVALISDENTKVLSRDSSCETTTREKILKSKKMVMSVAETIRITDEFCLNIEDIERIASEEAKKGAKIIIIDYLQLIDTKNKTEVREQQVAQISRRLKMLTKRLNVPIIALAQLRRSSDDAKPTLSHLRESGSLEQDADIVILLHRLSASKVNIEIAKGRNIGTAETVFSFNKDSQLFEEVKNANNSR